MFKYYRWQYISSNLVVFTLSPNIALLALSSPASDPYRWRCQSYHTPMWLTNMLHNIMLKGHSYPTPPTDLPCTHPTRPHISFTHFPHPQLTWPKLAHPQLTWTQLPHPRLPWPSLSELLFRDVEIHEPISPDSITPTQPKYDS